MNREFLQQILECVSVSGYEEPVQQVVEAQMRPYAHECRTDDMNNMVCVLNPQSGTKIMLSAHADEIGLMVSNITDEGRLQVITRGGIVPATYPGRAVKIRGKEGTIYGVTEACRELFDKEMKVKEFLIDIGAGSKEEAEELVELGAPIVPDSQMHDLAKGRFTARALDDRIGVFIIMEALKLAKERGAGAGVYAASTVGEETTKTGAYWTSSRIKPDLAVVVDVTYTSDCMGMNPAEMGTVELGKGPVLCNSPIVSKKLNEQMMVCAKKAGIEVQREAASRLSYTDGDQIHFSNEGVPIVLVSIPLRYMHMPNEVADFSDVENCIRLIAEFLCSYE